MRQTNNQPWASISVIFMLLLSLSACSGKSSKEVVADLWDGWEKTEQLMQVAFPDAAPLVLVHGWNGGEFTWPSADLLIQLEQRLQRDIYLFTYRTGLFANRYPPLEVLEEQLDHYLAPYQQVDIVAHSMGGLLIRQYLAHHADNPIRRVVFLATPHFGTNAAQILVQLGSVGAEGNIQATEIQPGSDFLWQLNSLDGAELEEVEVLNVYVEQQSLLKTDFVVSTASAYLPKATNITVKARHDTVADKLPELEQVLNFLQTGSLPDSIEPPVRRDVWLRFSDKSGLGPLRVSEQSFKVYNQRGLLEKDYRFCCQRRSGLYSQAGDKTVLLEDMANDSFVYEYVIAGEKTIRLTAAELIDEARPVSLKVIDVNADRVADKTNRDQDLTGIP